MLKKVYIIEAKVEQSKLEYLIEMMERKSKHFKRVQACTIADYIVTELKSSVRIIRNVKKVILLAVSKEEVQLLTLLFQSTCPIVHIDWLFQRYFITV